MDSLLKKYGSKLSVEEQARLGCLPEILTIRDIAYLWHQEQRVAMEAAINIIAQAIYEGRLRVRGETPPHAPDEIPAIRLPVITRLSPWRDWDQCPVEYPWGDSWQHKEPAPSPKLPSASHLLVEWSNVMVLFEDFRNWLKIEGVQPTELPECLYRWVWPESITAPPGMAVSTPISLTSKPAKKRNRQIEKIIEVIKRLEYPPKKIPQGGKSKIKAICCEENKLFTPDGFDHAWKEAKKRDLIEVEDVEQYKP